MNYIDLTLKKIENENEEYSLTNIVNNTDNIIIVLGSAGSGKTSILNKFLSENTDTTQFSTVKNFLKLNNVVSENTKVLLLDGLDEYRSIEADKTLVVDSLANKLSNIGKNIKVVISCREMDWYGDRDTESLKGALNKNVGLYQILPLNHKQKIALSELFGRNNPKEFIRKYEQYGFLENPQMLKMLVDIDKTNTGIITTKSELYIKFINSSLESNTEYTLNSLATIDISDIYKYAGYIAFYAIFCNIGKFDNDFIDNIIDNEKGYLKEKLQKTLSTKLFNEKNFIHRTIAEFLLAQFIIHTKCSTDIAKHRIKHIFKPDKRIPTELKGTFSWLCSLSKNLAIIKIDPYYQCSHGDNATFSNELKTNVILEIKKLSESNPYFMNFHDRDKLEGFYNAKLDTFLIQELKESLQLENYYFAFLYSIINTKEISNTMRDFLKEFAFNPLISSDHLAEIVKLISNKQFLKDILDKVKNDEIPDIKNRIKESILRILYPENMTYKEVVPYLLCYQKDDYSTNYLFLYKTDYKDKKALLDDMHNNKLSRNLEYFFHEYLAETISKFENELTAKDIYEIILHFKKYYDEYTVFRFKTFRTSTSNWLKSNEEKITKLANELFALYVDDVLKEEKENKLYCFYKFEYFFPYSPNNQVNILLDVMSKKIDTNKNQSLFSCALSYLPKDISGTIIPTKKIKEKAKLLHLEDMLNSWLNPKKPPYKIEQEKRMQQQKEKNAEQLAENETYLKSQTDSDIQKNLDVLHYVSRLLLAENQVHYLTDKTFNRIKGILKNSIFKPLIFPKSLTLSCFSKETHGFNRNIDTVYYISCILNEPKKIQKINNERFLEYLYINTLKHDRNFSNTQSIYVQYIEEENPKFAISTLKKCIRLIINVHAKKYLNIFMPYINLEISIERLKEIINYIDKKNIQKSILSNFLNAYNLSISLDDLKKLKSKAPANEDKITALIILLDKKENDFTLNTAISLCKLLSLNWRTNLSNINSNLKIRFIDYLMNVFDTEKSIQFVNGFQSDRDNCASFLERNALNQLNLNELNKLQNARKNKTNCIWKTESNTKLSKKSKKILTSLICLIL